MAGREGMSPHVNALAVIDSSALRSATRVAPTTSACSRQPSNAGEGRLATVPIVGRSGCGPSPTRVRLLADPPVAISVSTGRRIRPERVHGVKETASEKR